jgi:hypothetical protein
VNWAFDLLEVSPDIDVGGVKRAYARLLRKTRPDEDAEGFQRLHMAYQLVLAHATARDAGAAVQIAPATLPAFHGQPLGPVPGGRDLAAIRTTAELPVASAVSMPRPSESDTNTVIAVNPVELVNRVIRRAVANDEVRKLSAWLSEQPEFWSIRIKQQTGQQLLNQLFRNPQPMASPSLDTLLQFFDLEQVLSGVNPIALAQLRRRQLAMWYLLPQNDRALALRLNIPTNRSPDPRQMNACLRLLQMPWRWQSVLWPAIRQGRTAAIGRFIHGLCSGHLAELPPQINRAHAAFWYRAVLPGAMSWPRFAVGSVRAGFLALILMTVALGIATLIWWTSGDGTHMLTALGIGAVMAANILGLWLAYAGWIWLDHWQGLPESSPSRPVWLRRMLVPALCVLVAALDYLANAPVAATVILVPTLVMSLRRFNHRAKPRPRRKPIRLGSNLRGMGVLLVVLASIASKLAPELPEYVPVIVIGAVIPMGFWIADMWRHRHHFKRRAIA